MRLTLAIDVDSRDGTSTKDARCYNALVENDGGAKITAVRPGLTQSATTTGSGKGLVCWNGTLIAMYGTSAYSRIQPTYSWTAETMPSSADWAAIAWNGTVFCATCSVAGFTASNKAATSPDGITWTARTLPSSGNWCAIAWNGAVFCTVAFGSNKAATSPDGITWTARTLPSSTQWIDIVWNGSVFCAVGGGGGVSATSPDGITWAQGTLPMGVTGRRIAWNSAAGVFCTFNFGQINIATSSDGLIWTQQSFLTGDNWRSIGANGAIFCVFANNGNVTTSPDGVVWTLQAPVIGLVNSVTWTGEIFCAVAPSGIGAISTNGITWTQNNMLGGTQSWNAVAYGNGVLSAVADTSATSAIMRPNSFTNIGTVSGSFFDFAQSPT